MFYISETVNFNKIGKTRVSAIKKKIRKIYWKSTFLSLEWPKLVCYNLEIKTILYLRSAFSLLFINNTWTLLVYSDT